MKSLVTALSAATLATSVTAQAAALDPTKDIIPIIPSDALKNVEGEWKYDACHKIDTSVAGGFIRPCASQLKILVESCPTWANTAEERKAQRDCICGKGGSFLQDAVACSECKTQNGLQPDSQREFWKEYYGALDKEYCQPDDVAVDYNTFAQRLTARKSPPEGVITGNSLDGKIGNPREYYKLAGVAVPEKQGPGKSTPAVPQPGVDNTTVNADISDPVAGQVVVPAFVAVEVNNKTSGANTASVTPTPSAAGSQPTTLMRVTSWNSTAAATAPSLSPSSSLVPTSGPSGGADVAHVILINGKLCHVYIIWVIIDCAPKKDAQGKLYIEYKTTGIDNNKPISMLENKEQFDKIKDTMHDASKDKNCAEQLKDIVGSEAKVVAAPGNNKTLPPPEKPAAGVSKGPNGAAGPGTSGKPVTGTTGNNTPDVSDNEDECGDEDLPSVANTPNNGSTNIPNTHNTQNVPSGSTGAGSTDNKPATDNKPTTDNNTPAMSDNEDECDEEDLPSIANTPDNGSTNIPNTQNPQNTQNTQNIQNIQNPPSGGAETVVSGPEGTMKTPNTPQGSEKTPNTQDTPSGGAGTVASGPNGSKTNPNAPAQNSASIPGGQTGSNTPSISGSQSETKDCECPSVSKAPERKDATEICVKKVKTETDCKKESGENMRKCLCSEGSFQNQRFFDEAIICSRRSDGCLWGEFGAQVFFQTKYLYCDLKLFGNDFAAAYKNVSDSWRDARAPTALM
ncbi:hypothetical protein H634G_07543 [Metarhizium anisopliae BRIP 53293]|uniref:Extracellular membrane protein CFEM domain-containing protein n=1 Tax=Metarhizium anisopliae BRIP 53293 TaxID=1291518 RepID=A0A0D9NSV4_METAN|nr:hypothetical protein H634G_07543 [Metarhizium anisopliae BRIP 53293]